VSRLEAIEAAGATATATATSAAVDISRRELGVCPVFACWLRGRGTYSGRLMLMLGSHRIGKRP
jgi:hypothetical protein